jgi:cytochrome P450
VVPDVASQSRASQGEASGRQRAAGVRRLRWTGQGRVLLHTWRARRRGDAGAVLRALARGGGDAAGLRLRGRRVLLLLEPGLAGDLLAGQAAATVKGPGQRRIRPVLGDGLLTSEGPAHERARRLVAPAFSPRRLAAYGEVFAQCTTDLTSGWADGALIDAHAEMAALTLRIAGLTLLGTDLSNRAPLVRAGLEAALADFGGSGTRRNRGPQAGGAYDALHALVDDMIAQHRATGADTGDVLSALLAGAAGPDGAASSGTPGGPAGLTAQEIHDQVLTLLLAGHETTASALTWTLYLLARHPGVQRRLRAEVSALGGQPPAPDRLPTLRYTRAVISEAVRLYPPAWIIGRTLTKGLELAGRPLTAGTVVAVSPLLLHHDRRWFPDPERFDPDRWLDERRHAVPRYAYLPFGTGPRSCIGERFAWAETTTVLAMLTQSWSFKADPGYVPVPSYRVTLRPAIPVPLTLGSVGASGPATDGRNGGSHDPEGFLVC